MEKMNNKAHKFENPARVAELNPRETLIRVGFKDGMILCDIGAGPGIFSFQAAKISSNSIYALEKSDSMIDLLNARKDEFKVENLIIKSVESERLPIEDNTCDMVIMVTVLHEIEEKEAMLNEIKRILKEKGRFTVIEFHKKETPSGPPSEHRISENAVSKICNDNGFSAVDKFSLGENYYVLVFEKLSN
jgi:ubiquinone/menaquinone biosynthesis C-methylase UbiE